MPQLKNLIISVESRKGGVGKTTVALNLARLLKEEYGYAVLVLDLDITGTNIATSLNTPFWQDVVNVIEIKEQNDKEFRKVNLLEMFDKKYMSGISLPFMTFSKKEDTFQIDINKVNIFGSDLYNIGDDKKRYYCDPAILFDELHSYWFREFIEAICLSFENFASSHNKSSIVMFDNSPGFIGLTPKLNDWLTTMGPDKGKFLLVSSLDQQDIIASFFALDELHDSYIHKNLASEKFNNLDSKGNLSLLSNEKKFFFELMNEQSSSDKSKFSFYYNIIPEGTDEKKISEINKNYISNRISYQKYPQKYIGILFNRVPYETKSGNYSYSLREFKEIEKCKYYRQYMDESKKEVPIDLMVEYNEYLEYQFADQGIINNKLNNREKVDLLLEYYDNLISAFYHQLNVFSTTEVIDTTDFYKKATLQSFFESLESIRTLYQRLISFFRFDNLTEYRGLFRKEYEFHYSLKKLRSELKEIALKSGINVSMIRSRVGPFSIDSVLVKYLYEKFLQEYKEFDKEYSEKNRSDLEKNTRIMVILMTLVIKLSKQDIEMYQPFYRIFLWILILQQRIGVSHNVNDIQGLSMNKINSIKKDEIIYLLNKLPLDIDQDIIINLFKTILVIETRLLNIVNDMEFITEVVKYAISQNIYKRYKLYVIQKITDDVILTKMYTPDEGWKHIQKGISGLEHMEEFQEVLKPIISKWGIEK